MSTPRIEAAREPVERKPTIAARLDMPARLRLLSCRWPWLRHWEFWLTLAVGAFLRLWHLGTSQFLDDQAMLMSMARNSVLQHALPVTGIPSSIGALNPPFSVYLLVPFAFFTRDPFPAVVGIALWNVLGVALCYVFAWRYFGRRIAAIGALLFATSGAAVDFSRFLWQQNYLPPVLILWAFVTFAGALRGSRGWLIASVTLLALAALLHPTALLFIPVLLVAFLLAPRKPRVGEYVAAAAVLLVLATPTLVWEQLSGFPDLHVFQHYTAAAPQINFDVLGVMEQVLGPPTFPGSAGPATFAPATADSPYAAVAWWAPALWYLACVVYIASYAILTSLVIVPIVRRFREAPSSGLADRQRGFRTMRVWKTLRADSEWCIHLLLWLSVTIVPAAMIRHSSPVHAHYLHVLYPLLFILAGVGTDRLLRWSRSGVHHLVRSIGALPAHRIQRVGSALLVGSIAVLLIGQTLQSSLYTASQATGQVDNTYYGYSVSELQTADAALDTLQREQGTAGTYISTPVWYTSNALTYMLIGEHSGRTLDYGNCVVLPPAGSQPVLVVSTRTESPVAGLLAEMPNARLVRTLPMPGNEPFLVYRVQGDTPLLAHEQGISGLIFQDGFGNTMRLDGAALENGSALRLRWTVLRMAPPAGTQRRFYVDARAVDSGTGTGHAIAHVECDPTAWQNGSTVFTWVSTAAFTPPQQPAPPLPSAVALSAWDQVVYYAAPVRYGLRLLTADLVHESPNQLVAMNPQHLPLPAGLAVSRGELVAPTAALHSP